MARHEFVDAVRQDQIDIRRGERFAEFECRRVRRFAALGAAEAAAQRSFAQLLEDESLGVGDRRIGREDNFDQLRPVAAIGQDAQFDVGPIGDRFGFNPAALVVRDRMQPTDQSLAANPRFARKPLAQLCEQ